MSETPGAVVSLRCPDCGETPDPGCSRCKGHGIVMLRVRAEEATLSPDELRSRANASE